MQHQAAHPDLADPPQPLYLHLGLLAGQTPQIGGCQHCPGTPAGRCLAEERVLAQPLAHAEGGSRHAPAGQLQQLRMLHATGEGSSSAGGTCTMGMCMTSWQAPCHLCQQQHKQCMSCGVAALIWFTAPTMTVPEVLC